MKVLIANRGEIAVRVARTAKRLGYQTVAVYSDADREAWHTRFCDDAIRLGPAPAAESYLDIGKVIEAARRCRADLIHPGYGFLSERAELAEACEAAGIGFVGPTAGSMREMGDKIRARERADRLRVPRVPGSAGSVATSEHASLEARKAGFPILLKAAAGGGGKGMRRVDRLEDLASSFEGASREAKAAFGDGSLYVEKLVQEPHHVEVQVFGDGAGQAIHLGERECSVQRRHQKIWEETPAPVLSRFPALRERLFEASLRIARDLKYRGAGTMEFLVDGKGDFFFLEMNTRLQVEHPVTEWVTGADLVAWQLGLAAADRGDGAPWKLPPAPERKGASIEARVYAEDPATFLPAPGPVGLAEFPSSPFTRVDSSIQGKGDVSIHYDPLVAKISVWGADRGEALSRIREALDETRILRPRGPNGSVGSLRLNLRLLRRLSRLPALVAGDTPTDLMGKHPSLQGEEAAPSTILEEALLAVAVQDYASARSRAVPPSATSAWSRRSREEGLRS